MVNYVPTSYSSLGFTSVGINIDLTVLEKFGCVAMITVCYDMIMSFSSQVFALVTFNLSYIIFLF